MRKKFAELIQRHAAEDDSIGTQFPPRRKGHRVRRTRRRHRGIGIARDEIELALERQIVGRLVYEQMQERPATLYGMGIGSNYQAQGLKLSKHFRV